MPLGLIIEGLVAVLLLLTIGFCISLNRKLTTLRSDQSALQQIVAELDAATIRAEQAIRGLREAADEANTVLTQQMRHADKMSRDLGRQIAQGEEIVGKISAISRAARPDQGQTQGHASGQTPGQGAHALHAAQVSRPKNGAAA